MNYYRSDDDANYVVFLIMLIELTKEVDDGNHHINRIELVESNIKGCTIQNILRSTLSVFFFKSAKLRKTLISPHARSNIRHFF